MAEQLGQLTTDDRLKALDIIDVFGQTASRLIVDDCQTESALKAIDALGEAIDSAAINDFVGALCIRELVNIADASTFPMAWRSAAAKKLIGDGNTRRAEMSSERWQRISAIVKHKRLASL